jgi:hypothetical protein
VEGKLSTYFLYWGDESDAPTPSRPPPDPENFCYRLTVFATVENEKWTDTFNVMVCSPKWFAEQADTQWERRWQRHWGNHLGIPKSVMTGYSVWFMRRWDEGEFESAIRNICEHYSTGPNWGVVASRLARIMDWEWTTDYDRAVDRGETWPT